VGFAQCVRAFINKCEGRVLLAIWKRINPQDLPALTFDQFCSFVSLMLQAAPKERTVDNKEPNVDLVQKVFDKLVSVNQNVC
jgi:hypothetical protein